MVLVAAEQVTVVYPQEELELRDKVLLVALVVVEHITVAVVAVAHLLLVLMEQLLVGVMVALELRLLSLARQ